MNTLLETAKGYKGKTFSVKVTDEQKELALAWLRGDIEIKQVSYALELKGNYGKAYQILCLGLKKASDSGELR